MTINAEDHNDDTKIWEVRNVRLPKSAPAHAVAAANELIALDAPVYGHLAGERRGLHFIIGGEMRDSRDTMFADYYQEELRERFHPDDKDKPLGQRRVLNAFGVRTDVEAILKKHGLFSEWINPGQLGVFDA